MHGLRCRQGQVLDEYLNRLCLLRNHVELETPPNGQAGDGEGEFRSGGVAAGMDEASIQFSRTEIQWREPVALSSPWVGQGR